MTRKQFFRLAFEKRLIGDTEDWFAHHHARNHAAHAHNEDTAEAVHDTARRFAPDARKLLAEIERRANA